MKSPLDTFQQLAHFQQMLKDAHLVNSLETRAAAELRSLLEQVPAIQINDVQSQPSAIGQDIDFIASLNASGRTHQLICEVKGDGQPRNVRNALLQLRNHLAHFGQQATPLLIAPYLSPKSQALCRQANTGYLDFEGNARIVFDGIFIERSAPHQPVTERRDLRSLFKPKSAQVLTQMLANPERTWRVTELAAAAQVSLGHVSNVRAGLLNREWGRVTEDGLSLCDPDALLDAWRAAYQAPAGQRMSFYTILHGDALERAARDVLSRSADPGCAVFASFSAARWIAPYGRVATEYFYADERGLRRLAEALKLSSSTKGENIIVTVPKLNGVFRNAIEPAPGAVCTGFIQTYLDLSAAGERGQEAAEHLRQQSLKWRT